LNPSLRSFLDRPGPASLGALLQVEPGADDGVTSLLQSALGGRPCPSLLPASLDDVPALTLRFAAQLASALGRHQDGVLASAELLGRRPDDPRARLTHAAAVIAAGQDPTALLDPQVPDALAQERASLWLRLGRDDVAAAGGEGRLRDEAWLRRSRPVDGGQDPIFAAAVAWLRDPESAEPALEHAARVCGGRDRQRALLWRAELELRRGRSPDPWLTRGSEGGNTAYGLLLSAWEQSAARRRRTAAWADGAVDDLLPELFGDRLPGLLAEPKALAGALRLFFDGRGAWRDLEPLRSDPPRVLALRTARTESAATQPLLLSSGVAATSAALDALQVRFPRSPHPLNYRGEVRLWLGRYDDADADFSRSLALVESRWARIGRGAVHALAGRRWRASRLFRRSERVGGPLDGATSHVYRGEAALRAGDLTEAREALERTTSARPARATAWLLLAEVRRQGGGDAVGALRRFEAEAPGLALHLRVAAELPIVDGRERDLPALVRSLFENGGGNRSSRVFTALDGDGLRAWPPMSSLRSALGRLDDRRT
jgi:tetratricopeptide (TPR) repeat protein